MKSNDCMGLILSFVNPCKVLTHRQISKVFKEKIETERYPSSYDYKITGSGTKKVTVCKKCE